MAGPSAPGRTGSGASSRRDATAAPASPRARPGWSPTTALVGLLAAVPVLVSTIRAVDAQWLPFGDRALIAVEAYDVFSPHPPLIGEYSAASAAAGHPTHGLGPMLYWLLAVPSHVLGAAGTPLTMGLVGVCCVVGAVALARRRGGLPLMYATALVLVLMCRSLPAEIYHDSWNASAPILPFTLLLFLSWSVACGEYRLLVLMVATASFVAQCHLSLILPVALASLVALVGLALWWVAARRRGSVPTGARAWLLLALLVAVVCWSAPLIDQVVHRPGNLVAVARSLGNTGPTVGVRVGWHVVVRTVGVVPWWLSARGSVWDRIGDALDSPSLLSDVTCVMILLALSALVVWGIRRHHADVAGAAALGLLLGASVAVVGGGTPKSHELWLTLGYTLWWASPAGMFAWLALFYGGARVLAPRVRAPTAPPRWASAAALAVLGLAAVATGVAGQADLFAAEYRPMRAVIGQALARIPAQVSVRVARGSTNDSAYNFEAALFYALRDRGQRVVSSDLGPFLNGPYVGQGEDTGLLIDVDARPPRSSSAQAGADVIASVRISGDAAVTVAAWRLRGGA